MSSEIFEKYGKNPTILCQNWYEEAAALEPNDPEAVTLATATKDGQPSVRWVLVKEMDERGFKFHTNAESRKGREIAENPHGALCFYWKSTRKQIRIEGQIEEASAEESDQYFETRPIERQIGAWASKQSTPFEHREELEAAVQKYTEEFAGADNIPRPPYWKGFRLIPTSIEFWIGNKDRLHERFIYTKQDDGSWTAQWLCP
ncbi:MAG: pyridoxamine 5'-phosphate oxidase [Alphaproteobacteria bacterium]|nr:pyridoxamine 5'-phosphate oxidase [Alphaproteobacteria bacterium]